MEKWRGHSLSTVMYEKRKIRRIIIHFEVVPFEEGLLHHVLNSLTLRREAGGVLSFIYSFNFVRLRRWERHNVPHVEGEFLSVQRPLFYLQQAIVIPVTNTCVFVCMFRAGATLLPQSLQSLSGLIILTKVWDTSELLLLLFTPTFETAAYKNKKPESAGG